MKRLKYIFIITIVFVLFARGQVVNGHPRLILTDQIIQKLKQRRADNTAEWQRLKARMDAYYNLSGEEIISDYLGQYEYIMTYALGYYATDRTDYMDKAVDILMAFYNHTSDNSIEYDSGYHSRDHLFALAIGYDWCYNALSSNQRNAILQRLITWTDWIIDNGYAVWGSEYFVPGNNYAIGHLLGITAAGYAIYDENSTKANEYINHSNGTVSDVLPFLNSRLQGGDANEGWSYGSGYAMNLFQAFAIIKSASTSHTDYFQQTTWDDQVIYFLTYATLPDREHLLPNGDWARESTGLIWDQHRTVSDIISSFSDNEKSRQIACYWGPETFPTQDGHNFYVWRLFLYFNHEETPLDYKTTTPFSNQLWTFTDSSGTGQFVQRTDWSESAQWVSFRAGGMYGDHAHNGQGHFEIWQNGWLVIDENIKSHSGTLIPDSAHNRVQIDPVSYHWHIPRLGYTNAEHSRIPRREFTDTYSYIWENSTNIYKYQSDNTVTNTEREFLYLPNERMVWTFDNVSTESAGDQKLYRLHFFERPTLQNNILSYSNGTTKVFAHTVFPSDARISVHGNRIDVEYANRQTRNLFLHVLYTRSNNSGNFSVQEISPEKGNVTSAALYGGSVQMQNKTVVVAFLDPNAGNASDIEFSYSGTGLIDQYVLGLDRSTEYYVTISYQNSQTNVTISKSFRSGAQKITSSGNGVLKVTHTNGNVLMAPQKLRIRPKQP